MLLGCPGIKPATVRHFAGDEKSQYLIILSEPAVIRYTGVRPTIARTALSRGLVRVGSLEGEATLSAPPPPSLLNDVLGNKNVLGEPVTGTS